jgi:hypothetical protein
MWLEEADNSEAEPSLGSFDRMVDQSGRNLGVTGWREVQ